MPQDIPATCDGCGDKLSIDQALSSPLGYFILERHDDATNKWGTLGSRDLTPGAIYYEHVIISRTAQ